MNEPVLTAHALVVERAGRRVLDELSCELRRGEIMVVAGANGAGKSTLVRALGGLLPLHTGEVRRMAGIRAPAIVFDGGGLLRGLTVAETIALPLVRAKMPDQRVTDRIAWALARFDLTGLEQLPVEQLSRGQAVRVQLARATLMEPDVLLCDGPLDQIGPAAAVEISRLLRRAAASGAAVLITTNVPERFADFAPPLWQIEHGRLHASGTAI
jgi:ABC-type multidrug transport system ATPase subunit